MARLTLTTPGEDGSIGSGNPNQLDEVIGTTTGGEVITVNQGSRVTFDPSFNSGGDTIRLPGAPGTYTVQIEGSNIILTSTNGTVVELPLGTTANTLEFDVGVSLPIAIVGNGVNIGTQTVVDGDVIGGTPSNGTTVTLTANPDGTAANPLEANIFEAPRVFTPGGNDQINSLNDDDVLEGTGTNPTLNFTFVNDVDTTDMNINPTLIGIREINIAARFDGDGTLDLQDSTGVEEINVTGLDDFSNLTVDNIQAQDGPSSTWNLSVTDSNADNGGVSFLFDEDAVDGDDDTVNLTLDGAEVDYIDIDDESFDAGLGIEALNINSTGDDNEVGTLYVEDVEEVVITGEADLRLGDREEILRAGTEQVEAFRYVGGFDDSAEGSLTTIDASDFEGDLDIVINNEATAASDETSGDDVDLSVLGGEGDDIFRLVGTVDSDEDVIDGGEGNDTLYTNASISDGSIDSVELLDIRGGHGGDETIAIDARVFGDLEEIWIRNEGSDNGVPFETANAELLVDLNFLTAAQAANIQLQHGVTSSNGLDDLTIDVALTTTTGAADLVGVRWEDQLDEEDRGINTDPRFNFTVIGQSAVEDLTLTDDDSESNTVFVTNVAAVDGTLTLLNGDAGDFLNLDVHDAGAAVDGNLYGLDTDGGVDDDLSSSSSGEDAETIQQGSVAAVRFIGDIDGTAYVGNVIVRVGEADQVIELGSGDDTVIFDALDNDTAGLNVDDAVDGGDGYDSLTFEGDEEEITIGESEWLNVNNFEQITLVGNDGEDGLAQELGENEYNLDLTEELLEQNGVAEDGGVRRIIIRNDNDLSNEDASTDAVLDDTIGGNSGVTINATELDSGYTFTYNGEEGANDTADRFILDDETINGRVIIDGGASDADGSATDWANADVLEITATGGNDDAQVTLGDLAGITNVSNFEFSNRSAADIIHRMSLTDEIADDLVNDLHAAADDGDPLVNFDGDDEEVLTITVRDNPEGTDFVFDGDFNPADTTLVLDLSEFDFGEGVILNIVEEDGGDIMFTGITQAELDDAIADGHIFISAIDGYEVEDNEDPELVSALVPAAADNTVVLRYSEALNPLTVSPADFTVLVNGAAAAISSAVVVDQDLDGVADDVVITLADEVDQDDVVTVSVDDEGVEDLAGNESAEETDVAVANGSNDLSSGDAFVFTAGADTYSDNDPIGRTINALGGADSVTTGAGADVIEGGAGADTISSGDGTDRVDGGLGDDTINVGGADGDVDFVELNFETGTDTVTGFENGFDQIEFGGQLLAENDDVGAANGSIVFYAAQDGNDDATEAFNVLTAEGAFISFTQQDTLTEANFADLGNVAGTIADQFTFTNMTIGEDLIFAIQGDATVGTAIYSFVSNDNNNVVDADELTLIGVFSDADLVQASFANASFI